MGATVGVAAGVAVGAAVGVAVGVAAGAALPPNSQSTSLARTRRFSAALARAACFTASSCYGVNSVPSEEDTAIQSNSEDS